MRRAAWSPDGRSLATGGREAPIHIWDAGAGTVLTSLTGPGDLVQELEWSPDGGHLAAICSELACVWALRGTAAPVALGAASGPLAWSPDGRWLFVGAGDGAVRLWHTGADSAPPFAFCLSRVVEARFSRDRRELWLIDDGKASANRPIPYRLELTNFPETFRAT